MRQVPAGSTPRRARVLPWGFIALVGVVLVEIAVIVAIGRQIGLAATLLALIAHCALGGWLLRREGRRTWLRLRAAAQSGQSPSQELADAVLVLVGGILLVLPGFVTAGIGLLLALPFTRPVFRPVLAALIARRVFFDVGEVRVTRAERGSSPAAEEIIEGEIID